VKNPLIVYGLVAVVSFLVLFTALFLVFRPKTHRPPKVAASAKTAPDTTKAKPDTLLAKPDSLFLKNQKQTLADLKNRIDALSTDKKFRKYPAAKIDSLFRDLMAQVDSLDASQTSFSNYIAYQNRELHTLRDSLESARQNTSTLEQTIASMKAQKQPGVPSIASQKPVIQPSKGLQELATTYNGMKPERVAQLLGSMPDDKAIDILRKMNDRKRAKVLEVMPLARATQLTARMAG
jgi:flagellar motility protein MotE (MotC chaperone)